MNFIEIGTAEMLADTKRHSVGTWIGYKLFRTRYQLIGAFLLGVLLPWMIRSQLEIFPDQIERYDTTLLGTLTAILLGYLLYRKVTVLPGASARTNLLPAFLTSYLLVIFVFFALRLSYSRAQFFMSFVLTVTWFYAVMFIVARLRIVQFGLVCTRAAQKVEAHPSIKWHYFETPEQAANAPRMPLVVDFDHPGLTEKWERYIAEEAVQGRRIFSDRQLIESLAGTTSIDHLSPNEFGHLAPDSLYSPAKQYLDLVIAAFALIFIAPLLILVSIAIRLDSKGPALFRQVRVGYRGETFFLYKFRSMSIETTPDNQGTIADITQHSDQRITRVGRFIRKTRIDELPQIWNILLGQMSWIGPRPETIALSAWYEKEIPFYRYRHIVKPGISGWAQVKQGHVSSIEDVKRKLEYDLYYIKHYSIWTDILIVIQTAQVVISGYGAK